MLLWELLAYGGTPWGAFGVADMVQALRQGERMARPGLFEGEVEDKLYATAIRCWVTIPSKRPPFRQIFDELSVYSKALDVVSAGKNKEATHAGARTVAGEDTHAGARTVAGEDQLPCSDAAPPSAAPASAAREVQAMSHTDGCGTIRYMAPEVHGVGRHQRPHYDQSCDVYTRLACCCGRYSTSKSLFWTSRKSKSPMWCCRVAGRPLIRAWTVIQGLCDC